MSNKQHIRKSGWSCEICGRRNPENLELCRQCGAPKPPKKKNKFNAKKCYVDGIAFASQLEGDRYPLLKLLERSGEIKDLKVHPKWKLIVKGIQVSLYTADFSYVLNGELIVEDVKSKPTRTNDYIIRKKLMKALFGIEIQEVS